MNLETFIQLALEEDVREGDHTSLSCIRPDATGKAQLLIKSEGIIAGVELAQNIFHHINSLLELHIFKNDGDEIRKGDIAFEISGNARSILMGERLALNCMQRMSGIATLTNQFVKRVEGTKAKILDTRKTTPLFREQEKWAIRIGGGFNHRFGLYDMILIKDNHIDYSGGIVNAIELVKKYLSEQNLLLKIEIETRSIDDVKLVLKTGSVDRIMLDNFRLEDMRTAVKLVNGKFETEASGGVTIETIRAIAETGVDFISVGALTHSYSSMDMSLNAEIA